MYKVIFSDMDATLLSDDKTISKRNIEAINKARELGVKFVLCTGRLPFGYKQYQNVLEIKDALCGNGSIIISDHKVIYENPLPYNTRKKILDYGIKNNLYERIFGKDYLYLLNIELGGSDSNFYKESGGVNEIEARRVIKEEMIYKMAFHKSHEELLRIKEDITKLNIDVEMAFADDTFLELNVKGQSKGSGIINYCRLNNIDIKDTIAIGDNGNDLSMMTVAGLSCCPSNSIKEIKDICKYISPYDNNHDAIADVIEKFVLNREYTN